MWDLMLSEEQAMIADSVAQFLAAELPLERLRPNAAAAGSGSWRGMAELGWFALGLPEEAGGLALGLAEEMLVQRGCARHLATPSILATVLAAHVAHAAGEKAIVQALMAGEKRAALAFSAGPEIFAFDWTPDDLLVVWNDEEASLFAGTAFADARPDPSLDDSLTLHRGTLGSPHCRVAAAQARIGQRAEALLASRLVGLADGACALAADYAKLREQFGKPIGSFQAVKHRCADMLLRAETSGHLVALACLKVQARADDAPLQVAAAKLKAAHAAHENGRAVIQIHGGLGFQSECDAHWFMKRAHVYDQIGGSRQLQARRLFAAPSPLW